MVEYNKKNQVFITTHVFVILENTSQNDQTICLLMLTSNQRSTDTMHFSVIRNSQGT